MDAETRTDVVTPPAGLDVAPDAETAADPGPAPGSDPGSAAPSVPGRRRHRRRRTLMLFFGIPVAIAAVVGIAAGVAIWRVQSQVDHKIERFGDPFAAIPAASRAPAAAQAASAPTTAVNLLVFGSDSRISAGDPSQWEAGAQRTDAIMLVHIPADRSGAYVMSIPRDSWVDVPGHGKNKINAAFSYGGPALAIQTVENLTGVKIDHMVVTDFTGFARITDLLGGVKITVPQTTHGDTWGIGKNFTAGTYVMDGQTALTYVRQRYVLPGGDFDRVKRQQNWIRAIMRGAADSGAVTDPNKLLELLDTVASSVSTDSGFSIGEMRDLALSLRHVGPGGVAFMTAPIAGTGWSPDHQQSIVLLDTAKSRTLWAAVRSDKVATWISGTKYGTLDESVR